MHFVATADTDIGISKKNNQDSMLIRHANCRLGEVLMVIICDGMGGLSKGELASATAIREFDRWFEEDLPFELEVLDMQIIGNKWAFMLKDLNVKLAEYGQTMHENLGTTFTGVLFVNEQYVCAHVGDSRLYYLGGSIGQITTDQTFVAREVSRGALTPEQAKIDKRRNMLLQCVGASQTVDPELIYGKTEQGVYLLCSDGFRHEITPEEIYQFLNPMNLVNKDAMHGNVNYLINLVKTRQEKDNISAILVKVN